MECDDAEGRVHRGVEFDVQKGQVDKAAKSDAQKEWVGMETGFDLEAEVCMDMRVKSTGARGDVVVAFAVDVAERSLTLCLWLWRRLRLRDGGCGWWPLWVAGGVVDLNYFFYYYVEPMIRRTRTGRQAQRKIKT